MPFEKGKSGNPRGRPKKDFKLAELAQQYTEKALNVIVEILEFGENQKDKLKAAEILLDRGYGKAPQSVHADLTGDIEINVNITRRQRDKS